jgi:hypothetical protein
LRNTDKGDIKIYIQPLSEVVGYAVGEKVED